MKVLHIALSVKDLEASIKDYNIRLNAEPVAIAEGQYALWRTSQVNLSISQIPEEAGQLRHLGFEDSSAEEMSITYDADGISWEKFTAAQQRKEIFMFYPDAKYPRVVLEK